MATPIEVHKAGLAKLHQSEEFSDCKIVCGPYHFNLHKIILASQSDYFKAAFRARAFKEGSSGTIELKAIRPDSEDSSEADEACDDPEIVKLMVEYFYHFEYLPEAEPSKIGDDVDVWKSRPKGQRKQIGAGTQKNVDKPVPSWRISRAYLVEHAKVFAMAVKYQVDGLRDLAAGKFKHSAEAYWDHKDLARAISIVHTSTADNVSQLRSIVADVLYEHFDDLQDNEGIEAVMCSIPCLAYDLLKRKSGNPSEPKGRKRIKQQGYATADCQICEEPFEFWCGAGASVKAATLCYSRGAEQIGYDRTLPHALVAREPFTFARTRRANAVKGRMDSTRT